MPPKCLEVAALACSSRVNSVMRKAHRTSVELGTDAQLTKPWFCINLSGAPRFDVPLQKDEMTLLAFIKFQMNASALAHIHSVFLPVVLAALLPSGRGFDQQVGGLD